MSNDPLGLNGGDTNVRRYGSNCPTAFIDPTGLWQWYGNYGGPGWTNGTDEWTEDDNFPRQGDPDWVAPQDPRDWAYYDHDVNLNNAGYIEDPQERQAAREAADLQLSKELEAVREWYGNEFGDTRLEEWFFRNIRPNNNPKKYLGPPAPRPPGQPVYCLACNSNNQPPEDPNNLLGPSGYGPAGFLIGAGALGYTIEFSNEKTAQVPADNVVVTEQLSPNLDWSTFQLGTIGFGSYVVSVPPGLTSYSTRVDATATLGVYVDVDASLNLSTGLLTVTFTSLDPTTLDTPANPLVGFLPPDTNPPNGEGYINYTIQPKAGLATGATLDAQASIVFDTNAAIATPQIVNTIDTTTPTSTVTALPSTTTTPSFTVSWSGSDGAGSGIADYNVYVSDDGGAFTLFQANTTATSATFTGQLGHTYGFYSVATSNVGIVQPTPTSAQATTQIVSAAVATTTSLQSSEDPSIFGDSVTFTATVSPAQSTNGTPTGSVQFSIDGAAVGNPVPLDANGDATLTTSSSLVVGSHTVAASYINTDGNFNDSNATLNGGQTITPATPTITWANPAAITYGTALSLTQLDATASWTVGGMTVNVPGSFTYNPAAGAVLSAGSNQTLSVSFTPTDTSDYTSTSATATINVAQHVTTTTLAASTPEGAPGQTITFTASVAGGLPSPYLPTGSVQFEINGVNVGSPVPLTVNDTAAFSTTEPASGSFKVTAVYSADANFTASTSPAYTETVLSPGVYAVGTTLYVVGAYTSDYALISPWGSKLDGSTGLAVLATLNNAYTAKAFSQSFTAIDVFGYGGNDRFLLIPTLTLPTTVVEGNGNNYVLLAAGNDSVTLGSGSNQIFGGNGNKTITDADAARTSAYNSLGNGNDTISLGAGNGQVALGSGNNTVTAGNGNDTIKLGGGNDTVTLGNGNDIVQLGNGSDVIVEGNGNDYVSAGNGSDLVVGGLGRHTIQLGNGNDILIDGSATVVNSGDSLRQILSDWNASPSASVNTRLKVVYNTTHPNVLKAGSGRDWFFFKYSKDVTNIKSTDRLN